MSTVLEMKDEWVKTARLFGDVETVIAKIKVYESRYECDHDTFSLKIQTDEDFLRRVEKVNPVWEEDAMEWDYRLKEINEWMQKLEATLQQ